MSKQLVVYVQRDTHGWCHTKKKSDIQAVFLSVYPNLQFAKNLCDPRIDLM